MLQGLEAASLFLGLHILLPPLPPPPTLRLPSLPHQDTEHCMNSGLNGIISEFWSTANSGYFTNYLSLLCGGKNLGWGQVTNAGRPLFAACGGGDRLAAPPSGTHGFVGRCPPMSTGCLGRGRFQERHPWARPWDGKSGQAE